MKKKVTSDLKHPTILLEDNHLLIVNHEPTIRKLTLELSENSKKMRFKNEVSLKYPTCSLAILKLNSENWHDSKKDDCELINFIKPKDL